MAKFPFMKFYPADWIQDTRHLTPAAKGVWADVIAFMWSNQPRGVYARSFSAMARETGTPEPDLKAILQELSTVAIVDISPIGVTIKSRRILRDETEREYERNKKRAQRCPENVPASSPESPREKSEVRSQKSEVREDKQRPARPAKPARAPEPFWQNLIDHINLRWSWKKKGTKYLWGGKDFGNLKRALRVHHVSDLMALYDVYICSDDDFAYKNGYSVSEFIRQLPRLVDNPDSWKPKAAKYLDQLLPPKPVDPAHDVSKLVAEVASSMPHMPGRRV